MPSHTPREVLALCREREIGAVDLRFMDLLGTLRHFTLPVSALTERSFEDGFGFDGSSLRGWQVIHESDMLVVPDPSTAFVDPFMKQTLVMTGNIEDPITRKDYAKDPRNIARKAENYMKLTGIADSVQIGPEMEFFIFDDVRFDQNEHEGYYHIDSAEGQWNRGRIEPQRNSGHKIGYKAGYISVPPTDTLQDIRTEMMLTLQECGVDSEAQHHEVATAGQSEIDLKFGQLVQTADRLLIYKYVVKNTAAKHGKTATFMPKPLWNDNGSGMHLHLSLLKNNTNLFAGSGYAGLSDVGLFAIGGILKHAPAILAFCCPTTNSYKRLVAGFEAPINLSYSSRNRSAAIRIPVHPPRPENKRIEFRCPDSSANPYLAMASTLLAMLDGIQQRTNPGMPLDKDLYDLAPEELMNVPRTPVSLEESLAALRRDHDFLLRGDVFTEEVIDTWIRHKTETEIEALRQRPHPYEFAMYFDI